MSKTLEYSDPQPCNLSKTAVDGLAANVALQVGYSPGAELEPIVKGMGGRIAISGPSDIADASSGSIRIRGDQDFDILLARHTGLTRDRFTVAHEIGHFVLHYLWPKHRGILVGPVEAKRYGTGRVEWEANWFAAGFLMPSSVFKQSFLKLDGSQAGLAAEYRVSSEAVRVRIETLGLEK